MGAPSFRDIERALTEAIKATAHGTLSFRSDMGPGGTGDRMAVIIDPEQNLGDGGCAVFEFKLTEMARVIESELS